MTVKVRNIDWNPSDWLSGTRGLGIDETATYVTVVNMIYDRGGACPNDPVWIAGQMAKGKGRNRTSFAGAVKRTRAALAELIALGKLNVTGDGEWLTNGRADRELSRAGERIVGAARAGIASGKARRTRALSDARSMHRQRTLNAPLSESKLNKDKELARTTVRNHYPPYESDRKISTDPARDPAPDRGAPGRARSPGEELAEKPTPPDRPQTKATLGTLALAARKRLMGSG